MLMHDAGPDSVCETTTALLISRVTEYPEGLPEVVELELDRYPVAVRPESASAIDFLQPGGERKVESLNIYPLSGDLSLFSLGHIVQLMDRQGDYKITAADVRESSNYAKITVIKTDDR